MRPKGRFFHCGVAMMNTSTVLTCAGSVFGVLVVFALKKVYDRARAIVKTGFGLSPFEAREAMNATERAMFVRLQRLAPRGAAVLAQVQLSGFMRVKGLSDRKERWHYLNRIIRLSVDFLIVDAATSMPLLGIELDGKSHRGSSAFMSGQKDADKRKDQAFASSKVRLIRIDTHRQVSDTKLREVLENAFQRR
jgi:very-short-patch-repair endonuclease